MLYTSWNNGLTGTEISCTSQPIEFVAWIIGALYAMGIDERMIAEIIKSTCVIEGHRRSLDELAHRVRSDWLAYFLQRARQGLENRVQRSNTE